MKYLIIFLISLCVFSCTEDTSEDFLPKQTKEITFQTNSLEILTRASITTAGLTDLYVIENGITLLHQYSSDTSFGSPSLSLEYGTHTLYFLATKSSESSITNNIFSCSKVLDTFVKKVTIQVSSSTPLTQEISLDRCIYGISIAPKDKYPSDLYDMEVVVQDHSLTYSLLSSSGTSSEYSRVFSMTDYRNKTSSNAFTIYGFPIDGLDNVDVTINFRKENGEVIVSKSIDDLPIKVNQKTTLTGYFFDSSTTPTLSLNDSWGSGQVVDYNNR